MPQAGRALVRRAARCAGSIPAAEMSAKKPLADAQQRPRETPMLAIPLQKLAYIIIKAREYDVEEGEVDVESGSNPSDDREADVLEENPENPVREELTDAIEGLGQPERIELLALMWLGRGDYTKEDWHEALREAARVRDDREAEYLAATPMLASFLEEGLSQLGYSIDDYEIGRL
jgi:hypothetical protein